MVFDEEDAVPVIVTVLDDTVTPLAGDATDIDGGEDAKAFWLYDKPENVPADNKIKENIATKAKIDFNASGLEEYTIIMFSTYFL